MHMSSICWESFDLFTKFILTATSSSCNNSLTDLIGLKCFSKDRCDDEFVLMCLS